MLGEVAMYSFVILVITGVFLTFFYVPDVKSVVYHGPYKPLDGQTMSRAYESVMRISFEVRAGLVFRQIHHWAALVMTAAVVFHATRVFFTGAFRRPRELNWVLGVLLLVLTISIGFAGLLAAGRPAVGDRPAHRLLHRAVGPGHRDVAGVPGVRRASTRRRTS